MMLPAYQYEALTRRVRELPAPLSPTETQVMVRLCAGVKNAAIARQLGISPLTVNTHLSRVKRKFKASNVIHAAVIFAMGTQ